MPLVAQLGPTVSVTRHIRVAAAAPTRLLTLFREQKELSEMHGLTSSSEPSFCSFVLSKD